MRLYAFGYDGCHYLQCSRTQDWSSHAPVTRSILQARTIKILWSSWCDAVIACQDTTNAWTITCSGTGIIPAVRAHITGSAALKHAVSQPGGTIEFFGSKMHDGLRGYIIGDSNGQSDKLVIFSTNLEVETGAAAYKEYVVNGVWKIVAIQMDDRGGILVNLQSKITTDNKTLYFKDLQSLQTDIDTVFTVGSIVQIVATFTPIQWCTNSATTTVVDPRGRLYTMTRDPRYPKCLGRGGASTTGFEPVTYLSETCIKDIASGGYMSAAVSLEGELFIWGQANPGCGSDLLVLREGEALNTNRRKMAETGISTESDRDETVKCLDVLIDGEEAYTHCVAIGHGHVLVAAEVKEAGSTTKRAVLGAGVNNKGQLGSHLRGEFVEDFEEISAFRDKRIEQMVAIGWTTLVVTFED